MKPLDELPSIAQTLGVDNETVIFRYLVERTLFRLGAAFPDSFVLKGGLYLGLLAGGSYSAYRPTKDADLTAFGTWSPAEFKAAFEGLVQNNAERDNDGVWYSGKVRVKDISKGRNYSGQRVRITAHVGHERRVLSFDISQGAKLAEPALAWHFGTLLRTMRPPDGVLVYPLESVISEKLHAFHTSADPGTYGRIRDVYDLAYVLSVFDLDGTKIAAAVRATFESRVPSGPNGEVFWRKRPRTMTHAHLESDLQLEWAELLNSTRDGWFSPDLVDAALLVQAFANPLLDAMVAGEDFNGRWAALQGWS